MNILLIIELLTFSQWFYVTVIRFVRFLLELSLTIDVNKLFFPWSSTPFYSW